jgi:hypothetical protein
MEIDEKRCGMPKKVVLAIDADGNVITTYPSIKAAGRALNLKPSTINYRIRTGKYYKGILYRFKNGDDYTPYTTMVESEVIPDPSDAFGGQYRIIAYSTRLERICITPCPYKEGTRKVMVGSLQCEACRSFRGKKRNEHLIACDFRGW